MHISWRCRGRPRAGNTLWVFLLLGLLAGAHPATAQIPRIEVAEQGFADGLAAFQAGDYGLAFRRFQQVIEQYPLHRKTTAAWLMAGKALYRNGAYRRAADFLARFVDMYPTSGYVHEANRTRAFAQAYLDAPPVLDLGILLPLGVQDVRRTQMLFNGIRLAVDAHNAAAGSGPRVRMVFRDTRNDPRRAADLVRRLAHDGVDLIFGPLYSEEAVAAAAAAEQAGVVLVTPLATDEAVSQGRRFVFQANPTITMRGRMMARFAVNGLRLHTFGIMAELNDSVGERMAEGFEDEALRMGATVAFFELLPDARTWGRLPETFGVDSLSSVDALYLPIPSAGNPVSIAGAVLAGLERSGTNARVLGGKAWHDLPLALQASAYETTYTNDFFVDPTRADVQRFDRQYRVLAGNAPNRLAYTGYDVTRFLIGEWTTHPGQAPADALRAAPAYEGLGMRIHFKGGNVNQALFYHRYRDGVLRLLR